ncbi:MAG: ArdC family protein [Atopobiaceae bacterium]
MARDAGGGREAIAEARRQVVEEISAAMERGGLAWAAEWKGCWSPVNAATGRTYRGMNRLSLAAAMRRDGFDDPRWCTFNQARDAGWHVARGARSPATVEFWSWYVRVPGSGIVTLQRAEQLVRTGRLPEDALKDAFLRGRLHHVFNASQVEGVEPYDPSTHAPENAEVERVADELIESSRCPVREERVDEAYYRPSTDTITLPLRTQFTSMDAFARTLLHEMCHSTAREVGREVERSEEGYAREELVAELGSAFAAADAGLDMGAYANADMGRTFLENHAAYLQGWLTAIRDDPSALAKAATQASKAADFVTDRRGRMVASREDAARTNALDRVPLSSRARLAQEATESTRVARTHGRATEPPCVRRAAGRGET